MWGTARQDTLRQGTVYHGGHTTNPKRRQLPREMVLRPPKLSLSPAPPNYKAPGQGNTGPLTPTRSITPGLHTGAQTHGPRQWTITCAQSQSKPPPPKHKGNCGARSHVQKVLSYVLGFLLWVPGEMGDLANQTGGGRVQGQFPQGASRDLGPVQHLLYVHV